MLSLRNQTTVEPNYSGTKLQWNQTTVEPNYSGTKLQWNQTTVEPNYSGTKLQWNQTTVEPSVLANHSTLINRTLKIQMAPSVLYQHGCLYTPESCMIKHENRTNKPISYFTYIHIVSTLHTYYIFSLDYT